MTSLGTVTVKPFDKTLTLWARRKVLPADQFAALGDEQKAKAGRLAGIYHTSFTQAIYDSLGKAISEGQTVRDWAPQAQQILDGFGAAKGERIYSGDTWSPWYADLVFRTATQAAYAGGRYAEMFSPEWMTNAPYWLYDATNDGRTRPEHAALDGLVFRKDDARARHFLPPCGFGCRCHAIELDEDDFKAGGYKLSKGQDIREALPPGWDADRVSSLVPASMRRAKPVAKTPRPAIEGTTGDGWPHDPDSLKLVKKLGGSTGAELVEDAAGNRFVRKRGANAAHVREEFAADRMYEALGVNVPEGRLYDGPGGPVKLTRFLTGERLRDVVAAGGPRAAKVLERLQRDLAADALLGNWDVVGLDNVLVDAKGVPWRIDNGGALRYRGAGVLKGAFGEYPIELWSLRDPKLNPDAGPMFKGTDPATIPARIRQIAAQRSALLAATPADLRAVLGARLDQLVSVADLMDEATADKWKIGYADELARHTIGIRKAGLSARMPREMTQRYPGDMQPLDENGLEFDHLRTPTGGTPSLVADLATYIKSVGGNYAMVSAWASAQAGSSWNPFPMAIKYLMAENRTVRLSAYFWKGGSAASEAQLKKSFTLSGEAAVRVTFAAQHAFTRELLGLMKVAGRTNASGTGISLFRTENLAAVVKKYGLSRGLLHRFPRGAMESTSIYRAPSVHGSEAFRYDDVPLLRILGLYFQERRPGSRSGLFLGDGENEFVALLEGLQGRYL